MIDALGRPDSLALLGGTSEIGLAVARALAADRTRRVVLAGRDLAGLEVAASSVRTAGASDVTTVAFDATAVEDHDAVVEALFGGGDLVVAVVALGVLGAGAETDPDAAVRVAQTNYVGAMSLALRVSAAMRRQGHGVLVVLSSVAGERGRASNFVYGSSKAGLDTFAQGLGDALHGTGVRVVVVRPGFVRTRMTQGLEPAPLATTPEAVAAATVRAIHGRSQTVWVPGTLRWVMSGLRHLPRPVFRRLDL